MSKTTCCSLEYIGDNHSPLRSDGYCMHCGFHPGIQSLQSQLKEAIAVIEFYGSLRSNKYKNGLAPARVIDEDVEHIEVASHGVVRVGGKRAREFLAKVKEIEE